MAALTMYAASRTSGMPKALCMVGMGVAILLILLFLLDLIVGIPFGRASMLMDVLMILCALLLGFVSWTTYKEQA
jgi:hypothetical protein